MAQAPTQREHLIAHGAVVVGGTVTAGLLGFAFQIVASHQLTPADFGSLFASMSLFTLVSLPASALTLLMAREASRSRAGDTIAGAALLQSGNRVLLMVGVGVAVLSALGAPWLGPFFKIPIPLVVAAAASLPTSFAGPLLMGELQGEERFAEFSLLMVGQSALKLVASFLLGLLFGALGFIAGLALASFAAYGVLLMLLKGRPAVSARVPWFGNSLKYLAIIVPSTMAISLLLSTDVLLAKHFFTSQTAGEYAAVGALGRAIYWGAAGVAAVVFPKVVFREAQGASGLRIVGVSLALVVVGGIAGLVALSVGSNLVLGSFAGRAYLGGAPYLPWYAIAMTLLGCASILIAAHQSRAERTFLAVLIPLALAEPAAIFAFHESPMQVVEVLTITMGALAAGLTILLVRQPVRRRAVVAAAGVAEA